MSKTKHQQRVEEFMIKAGREIPSSPVIPSEEMRLLRSRLILEEALETIQALGFNVSVNKVIVSPKLENVDLEQGPEPDLVEIADGCADISVVTTGTLSACGISDEKLLEEVDLHNLSKFGPGSYRRESDGKWMKPKDLKPPQIDKIIEEQRKDLHVFFNGEDFVIARNEDHAQEILNKATEHIESEENKPWRIYESGKIIQVEDLKTSRITELTSKEWISCMGEGYLNSY